MRSFYSKDEMLVAVAKKKPRLQALIDRVADMSDLEIKALSEPLWVREGLEILRQANGSSQKERINQIVQRVIEAEKAAEAIPKPTYEVRIWDCDSTFIGSNGSNHSWKIEVENGDSLMILDENQVRFGDSILSVGHDDRFSLFHCSKFIGYMTLDNYRGFHRALLNQKHKNL